MSRVASSWNVCTHASSVVHCPLSLRWMSALRLCDNVIIALGIVCVVRCASAVRRSSSSNSSTGVSIWCFVASVQRRESPCVVGWSMAVELNMSRWSSFSAWMWLSMRASAVA